MAKMIKCEINKWMHIVRTNKGFYVNGSLVGAIVTLAGYGIINIMSGGANAIWLQLKKKWMRMIVNI